MNGTVLTRPDPMGRSFAFAIALHGALLAAFLISNWVAPGETFGAKDAGGASVGVQAVDKIPLPHEGPRNPVAHETEQEAPQAPPEKVEHEKKEVIPPDAIKLNLHQKETKRPAKEESNPHHFKSFDQLEKNQLTVKTPQAVSSPLFSQMPGSGRVGMGINTTLGSRFAGYAQQVQEQIARNWNTGDVPVRTAPAVIATFTLMKDGTVRNVAILQGSGMQSLDFSVRRAIEGAKIPPLPPGFDKDSAKCEFTFELKK